MISEVFLVFSVYPKSINTWFENVEVWLGNKIKFEYLDLRKPYKQLYFWLKYELTKKLI